MVSINSSKPFEKYHFTNLPKLKWTQLETIGKYNSICSQSPPPAHQQTSPVTLKELPQLPLHFINENFSFKQGEGAYLPRREHYILYNEYVRNQGLNNARIPFIPR